MLIRDKFTREAECPFCGKICVWKESPTLDLVKEYYVDERCGHLADDCEKIDDYIEEIWFEQISKEEKSISIKVVAHVQPQEDEG